jgi:hypothetical protein
MEKVIVQEQNYKTIKDGIINVTKYKTSDGQLFSYESQANDHEKWYIRTVIENKVKSLPFNDLDIGENPSFWYYAIDEEALDNIKKYFRVGANDVKYDCEFRVGDWYGRWTDYGGDYPDTDYIISWAEKKKELIDYIDSFNR